MQTWRVKGLQQASGTLTGSVSHVNCMGKEGLKRVGELGKQQTARGHVGLQRTQESPTSLAGEGVVFMPTVGT